MPPPSVPATFLEKKQANQFPWPLVFPGAISRANVDACLHCPLRDARSCTSSPYTFVAHVNSSS
eukprot:8047060-Prorocentrum_lima.AAC.1